MRRLIADSGSTKTAWALVEESPGMPKVIRTVITQGLNPLYVKPEDITAALQLALEQGSPVDELFFYGSGCSGGREAVVEQALRRALTPLTRVSVQSDLMGACKALSDSGQKQQTPFVACILGTGAIAASYFPDTQTMTPMPALGYILGDEGGGAWFGRQLLSDYLKGQMPARVREEFEDDFGTITPEQAIRHVYQLPCPNRYLATFAAYLGRHPHSAYSQQLSYQGLSLFWRRNVMRAVEQSGVCDVRLVGSVAYHLREVIDRVAVENDCVVTRVLKDPIEGLV